MGLLASLLADCLAIELLSDGRKAILIFIQNFRLTSFLLTLILHCPVGKAYPLFVETPNVSESHKQGIWEKACPHFSQPTKIFTFAAYFISSLLPFPRGAFILIPALYRLTVTGQQILNLPIYAENRRWCDWINVCIACWKLDILTSALAW